MIFNSQGDAKLKQFINGGSITPGPDPITLPKGGQLLGDLTIEAADTDAAYEEGYNSGYTAGYAAGYEEGQAAAVPYSKELQYIESTGEQWIDTGIQPSSAISAEIDYQVTAIENDKWFFSVLNLSNSAGWRAGVFNNAFYLVDMQASQTTVLNRTKFTGNATQSPGYNVYMFAENRNGAAYGMAKGKLYSLKIYNNGTLVRNYIPVLDLYGVACLFDKVNKRLHYNQGSGSFSYAE